MHSANYSRREREGENPKNSLSKTHTHIYTPAKFNKRKDRVNPLPSKRNCSFPRYINPAKNVSYPLPPNNLLESNNGAKRRNKRRGRKREREGEKSKKEKVLKNSPSSLPLLHTSPRPRGARWLQKRLNYRGRKRVPSGLIRPRKMRAESDARRWRLVHWWEQ